MNVIVSNQKKTELTSLDIDVIKSVSGEFDVDELISMFKNFFYEKVIIDVTSIKNYREINSIERLAMGLGAEKIIILLSDELCYNNYLNGLINVGIYNFTNNIKAIKRLIARPNTYDDVIKITQQTAISEEIESRVSDSINSEDNKVIGVKNVTEKAGSTTLVYMLLKELKKVFGNNVYAIELNKKDFQYFNDKNMISISDSEIESKLNELRNADVILIDLNDCKKESFCDDMVYLLEPSTIRLNQLIRSNHTVFSKLKGKKIVLNKSMLSNKDVTEFEYESNSKIFYNIPPLDERTKNEILNDFLSRLDIIDETGAKKEDGSKIFGIFRH